MTFGLLKLLLTKSKLLRKKLNQPTANNTVKYKTCLNIYHKIKRQVKTAYYHNLLEINKKQNEENLAYIKQGTRQIK